MTASPGVRAAEGRAPVTPGSLLGIGVLLQVVGGFFIGAGLGQSEGGVLLGLVIAWSGGLVLLVGLIAFGVKLGIETATPAKQSS